MFPIDDKKLQRRFVRSKILQYLSLNKIFAHNRNNFYVKTYFFPLARKYLSILRAYKNSHLYSNSFLSIHMKISM